MWTAAAASAQPSAGGETDRAAAGERRAVLRGLQFARRNCSGCHNVTADDGAPYLGPPFRAFAEQLDSGDLMARFARVSAHGSDEMPPILIPPARQADLAAYIRTLAGARQAEVEAGSAVRRAPSL